LGGLHLLHPILGEEFGISPLLASQAAFGVELIHGPKQPIPLHLQPLEHRGIHARLGSSIGRFTTENLLVRLFTPL
jgi:hypothetical protein